jgi:hypothetical protein
MAYLDNAVFVTTEGNPRTMNIVTVMLEKLWKGSYNVCVISGDVEGVRVRLQKSGE